MRLSEDKIEIIAGELVDLLESRPDLAAIEGSRSRLERDLVRFLVRDLSIEDEITKEAMEKVDSYGRKIPHGTTEWTVLVEKHKKEIAARRGYVI